MHALHQSLALDLLFDARSHSNDWDLSCGRDAVCRGLLYAKSSDGFSTFLRTDMVWPLCWSTIGFQLNHDTFFGWTVNKQSSQYYLDPCLSLKKKGTSNPWLQKRLSFARKDANLWCLKKPQKTTGKQVRNWWKSSQHQHQGVKNLAAAKAPRSHRPRRQQPPTQPRSLVGSTHWKSIFIMSIYAFLCISVIRHLEFPIYGSRYCEREGVREGANEMCSHMCVRLCFCFWIYILYVLVRSCVTAFVCLCFCLLVDCLLACL